MSESQKAGTGGRVPLRVSVHDVGGRPYWGAAEVRLERDGRTTEFTTAEGEPFAEERVEPGTYGLVVIAGDLNLTASGGRGRTRGQDHVRLPGTEGLAVLPARRARRPLRAPRRPARGRLPLGQARSRDRGSADAGDRRPGRASGGFLCAARTNPPSAASARPTPLSSPTTPVLPSGCSSSRTRLPPTSAGTPPRSSATSSATTQGSAYRSTWNRDRSRSSTTATWSASATG